MLLLFKLFLEIDQTSSINIKILANQREALLDTPALRVAIVLDLGNRGALLVKVALVHPLAVRMRRPSCGNGATA